MAPPVNDTCANALALPTTMPFTIVIDTTQATDDPGTPDDNWGTGSSYNGVWYTWTAPPGVTRLGVTMSDSQGEGALSFFEGPCGALVTPADEQGGYSTRTGHTVENDGFVPGQQYYVLVTSYDPGGAPDISITFYHPEPKGDVCCSAIVTTPWPCTACTTLTEATQALADRLQDHDMVHWVQPELVRYLVEAVRTWQALTSEVRAHGVFNTSPMAPFYDLPTVLPDLRAYTVTDRYLIQDLEYALMEAPTPDTWTGTAQFIYADLVRALTHRRDRFLYETGMVLRRFLADFTTPPVSGRVPFDPSIILIRRVAWQNNTTGDTYPLSRDDEWSLQSWRRQWPMQPTTPGSLDPIVWSVGMTVPLVLQLGPPISDPGALDYVAGTLDYIVVQAIPCLDPALTPGILGIPDDWTWVAKFGALAEILSTQGVSYDPQRAAYCEARFRHGLSLARSASVVLAARIDGQPIQLDGLADWDQYSRSWQRTYGTPVAGALAGCNLVALTPIPGSTPSSVVLDVVRNFPIPVNAGDCLGVEGQVLDAVLDYAEHLAMFKEGPDELRLSMDLLDRFMRVAGVSTMVDWGSVMNRPPIVNQTRLDERQLPRQIMPLNETLTLQPPDPTIPGGPQ